MLKRREERPFTLKHTTFPCSANTRERAPSNLQPRVLFRAPVILSPFLSGRSKDVKLSQKEKDVKADVTASMAQRKMSESHLQIPKVVFGQREARHLRKYFEICCFIGRLECLRLKRSPPAVDFVRLCSKEMLVWNTLGVFRSHFRQTTCPWKEKLASRWAFVQKNISF